MESHESYNQSTRAGMGPTHRRYVAPPLPCSTPVSLGNTMNPLRMTLKTSAPSRPPFPRRRLAPDARGPAPNRAPTLTADACRLLPQMISLGRPSHRASVFAADARVPLAADDYPRLTPPASLLHDRGCPRFIADDFPLRPHWRRSGCLC